jgi:hypothetical protein
MQEISFTLTLAEVNQILDALGQRPYADVYQLIAKIQAQTTQQLEQPSVFPER